MKKILIIDDSALMRMIMSGIISEEENLCVVDTAENGSIAVGYLKENKEYDLILMDINMPKMDGISFLEYMNRNDYRIPVLVVSSIASRNTAETIRALELGAYDFVKKPEKTKEAMFGKFRELLISKINCGLDMNQDASYSDSKRSVEPSPDVQEPANTGDRKQGVSGGMGRKLVFIASSTGGPKALQTVIPGLPADIGCPVVVVQHMPEGFTSSLAERLDEMSQCRVVETEDGTVLEKNKIYIAKGGYQLTIVPTGAGRHSLVLRKDPPRNGLRPCADVFLESLAESEYDRIYCAVLTGMGSDGTKGLVKLKKQKDVFTVGQSKETCVVYGMPRAAAEAGIVDCVAKLKDVADCLAQRVKG